jgi:hypothetical protein
VQDNLGRLTPALERLRARYTAALERLSAHPAGKSPAATPDAVAGDERDRLRHEALTGAIDEHGDPVWFVSPSQLMKRGAPEAEGERADAKQPPEPD